MGSGMRGGRRRLVLPVLALTGLPAVAAGCAFEGQIGVQLVGDAPAVVKETFKVELTPHRVHGATTRARQVIRVDCSVTGVFDVREATGSAVLIQLYVVHLRTRPLPRGTRYDIDCGGPLIMQLPADASVVRAVATDASRSQIPLSVQAPLSAVPLASGKHLRAERGTRFAAVGSPSLAAGGYAVELTFNLPEARAIRQKALLTASVTCGRARYVQPIRPLVTSMAGATAVALRPSATETSVSTPHLFGGIRSYGEATRTLSCAR
jgi:hypothetical protein